MKFSPVVLLIVSIALVSALKLSDLPRKKLAGPPSEFSIHKLPTPTDAAVLEDSFFQQVTLAVQPEHEDDDKVKLSWTTPINVDSDEEFILSIFLASNEKLKVKLVDPNGKKVNLDSVAVQGSYPIGSMSIPETSYRFENPVKGTWTLSIKSVNKYSGSKLAQFAAAAPHGAILVWNKSVTRAYTHLNTYSLIKGESIGLVTAVTDQTDVIDGVRPQAKTEVIASAEMDIVLPDGNEVDVQMHDDGLHGDLESNDGIYGAIIPASETGVYRASAIIKGTHPDGTPFVRTTQHLIPVVEDTLDLTSTTFTEMPDKDHMNIYVGVKSTSDADTLYRAYAEVWGKDDSNNDIAVCWVGGMVSVQEYKNQPTIAFELNMDWLSLAKAKAPLTLKNVVVQETSSYIPVAEEAQIPVNMAKFHALYIQNMVRNVTEITTEMRRGKQVSLSHLFRGNFTAGSGTLILTHGYCSSENPWQANSKDFTNAAFFLDPSANRNNEQFAINLMNFAAEKGIGAFSLIGHSQGGMVGAHLLNYFFTGLDSVTGGRAVQSVGTPFQGCSAAGSSASLGEIFGIGCGSNTDLSLDGAKLWNAGLSADIQKEVYSYTSTYAQGSWFGDYCNMAINAILQWPNDGTTELKYAKLAYGNYMGNTEKQCHTSGMKYNPQYFDSARNKEMNALAAR